MDHIQSIDANFMKIDKVVFEITSSMNIEYVTSLYNKNIINILLFIILLLLL